MQEDEEEEEDNSFVELYFQPKFQHKQDMKIAFENGTMLEVLVAFMEEKIYDELRTNQ